MTMIISDGETEKLKFSGMFLSTQAQQVAHKSDS